jgi:hypothetical protein
LPSHARWKKLIGFVPQEDVMIRQLTVRDNIEFSANYRLPIEMSKVERTAIVNETLIDLGIEHVQFSVIGVPSSTSLVPALLSDLHSQAMSASAGSLAGRGRESTSASS